MAFGCADEIGVEGREDEPKIVSEPVSIHAAHWSDQDLEHRTLTVYLMKTITDDRKSGHVPGSETQTTSPPNFKLVVDCTSPHGLPTTFCIHLQ
jgi:hypothetical protein